MCHVLYYLIGEPDQKQDLLFLRVTDHGPGDLILTLEGIEDEFHFPCVVLLKNKNKVPVLDGLFLIVGEEGLYFVHHLLYHLDLPFVLNYYNNTCHAI